MLKGDPYTSLKAVLVIAVTTFGKVKHHSDASKLVYQPTFDMEIAGVMPPRCLRKHIAKQAKIH